MTHLDPSPVQFPAAAAGERAFPALVLACMTTGTALMEGAMSPIHEAAEHILGHPVWTHEFAEKAVWTRLREAIRAHHPSLPFGTPENWQHTRDEVLARFPDPLVMPRGQDQRAEDPIASATCIMGSH